MPRRHFKPDFSFFNKIVLGAVGANAVRQDLAGQGFRLIELERGATDAKIWKEVKRKRVRIPDLVCTRTGLRVESRAKSKAALRMSHSPEEAERAWDFGMVDDDWIAFPVCGSVSEASWARGEYEGDLSYFRQRVAERWERVGAINYVPVGEFRRVRHAGGSRKGVVEASEYSIEWAAQFSTRTGPVRYVDGRKVCIENEEGRAYTWTIPEELEILVREGEQVYENQLFASSVRPVSPEEARVPDLRSADLHRFLTSKERTMRFTGVKLARVRKDATHEAAIREIAEDSDEDLYVRLEALVYLSAVIEESVQALFERYLNSGEEETALEAVISVGEVGNRDAIRVLETLLFDNDQPFFIRSAVAWSLGKISDSAASDVLIRAFGDQALEIREEALQGLVTLGSHARQNLLEGLATNSPGVAAGCAEALRQQQGLDASAVREILSSLRADDPNHWGVWLIGNLPSATVAPMIREMDGLDSEVHYALSLLWSFGRSWIAQHWERNTLPSHWHQELEGA